MLCNQSYHAKLLERSDPTLMYLQAHIRYLSGEAKAVNFLAEQLRCRRTGSHLRLMKSRARTESAVM